MNDKPNIVFVLAGNVGYGDLGPYGIHSHDALNGDAILHGHRDHLKFVMCRRCSQRKSVPAFRVKLWVGVLLAALSASKLLAQDQKPAAGAVSSAESQADALQKAVQNPVASLISVPLQNNANLGYGPFNRVQDVLELEPVIPIRLSDKWNLITRTIQPFIGQPYTDQNTGGEYGLGDMNPSFFLSPAKPGKVIWGAGPTFVIPTATNKILGQGKLSMGPAVVLLTQPPHWTLGLITNNVWSVAGSGGRPAVNQFLLQYFINYDLKKHWYLQTAPIITANWKASSGNEWTVPVGGGVGKIMKLGNQPINWQVEFYGNAVYPSGGSSWTFRSEISFLFPKLSAAEKKMLLEEQLKKLEEEQKAASAKK